MRKAYQIFALTAAAMICAGIVFLTIGLAAGALPVMRIGTVNTEDFSQDFSDVTSVHIKMGVGSLRIEEGPLRVEAKNISKNDFSCSQSGKMLEIKENSKGGIHLFGISLGFWDWDSRPTITLYLPSNYMLDEFRLDAGAGEIDVSSLRATGADLRIGAGRVAMDAITCDTLAIQGGAGEIRMENALIKEANVQSGGGTVRINGAILGNSRFESGVGTLVLDLKGNEEDYRFEVSSGIGDVRINDTKVTGTGKNTVGNSDAPYFFRINSGIGSVTIQIAE